MIVFENISIEKLIAWIKRNPLKYPFSIHLEKHVIVYIFIKASFSQKIPPLSIQINVISGYHKGEYKI